MSEPEPSEPEPHRVTALDPAPAPTKRCGSLRLRLRNTAVQRAPLQQCQFLQQQLTSGLTTYDLIFKKNNHTKMLRICNTCCMESKNTVSYGNYDIFNESFFK
jgi:hypothetical protein